MTCTFEIYDLFTYFCCLAFFGALKCDYSKGDYYWTLLILY